MSSRWIVWGALLLLALVGVALWRRVRRARFLRALRKKLGRNKPRYPIVLVHGLFGFDAVGAIEYFRGVRANLERAGLKVHRVKLPMSASTRERAEVLARAIDGIGEKVNIIAHSMGGIDARYAIRELHLGDRVASLVTIGTPHFGTPIAGLAAATVKRSGVAMLAKRLGFTLDALDDLTVEQAREFNRAITDDGRVFYASVVTSATPSKMSPALLATYALLRKTGPNDGLVPTESMRWGEVILEIEGDHYAQVGWAPGIDAPRLYLDIARELAWRGC